MNKRTGLSLAAVLLVVGWNIGCSSREPVEVQNRLLQQLGTLSPDWDNVRVVEGERSDNKVRYLTFIASFQRDGARYSMDASEFISPDLDSVTLMIGDVDAYDKPSREIMIGGYQQQKDNPGRLELSKGLTSLPLWDEAKLKRFLPLAEQFRQAIRDVL
jgi:hypothetical protein